MTEIADIHGEILDSRGIPTVEVEITLDSGAVGRAPCCWALQMERHQQSRSATAARGMGGPRARSRRGAVNGG